MGVERFQDEDEYLRMWDQANIQYAEDEGDEEFASDGEVEETEIGEVNLMRLDWSQEPEECYFIPKRRSDLLYCRTYFTRSKAGPVRTLMDCGSTVNLLREDVVAECGFERFVRNTEKPRTVYGFNDAKTVIRKEIQIECVIGPVKIVGVFLVVPREAMQTQRAIHGKPNLLKMGLWQLIEKFMMERLKQ